MSWQTNCFPLVGTCLVYNDKVAMRGRKLYDEVEFHRALQALGKKPEQYSDLFVPMIENKLPENIRVSVLAKKDDIWNMSEMLAVLANKINIRDKSRPTYAKIRKAKVVVEWHQKKD